MMKNAMANLIGLAFGQGKRLVHMAKEHEPFGLPAPIVVTLQVVIVLLAVLFFVQRAGVSLT